jgi:hypothetical protein
MAGLYLSVQIGATAIAHIPIRVVPASGEKGMKPITLDTHGQIIYGELS